MKKSFSIIILVFCLVALTTTNVSASVYGGKWATNPTYYVSPSTNVYYSEFNQAVTSWNTALSSIGASIRYNYATFGSASFFPNEDYYGTACGWHAYGISGPNQYSGTYTSATLKLNRSYMDNFTSAKRKAIITHELGHILGLAHNSFTSPQTLMYEGGSDIYYNSWGISSPTNTDISTLNSIY